jgi:hypothetical protein
LGTFVAHPGVHGRRFHRSRRSERPALAQLATAVRATPGNS